MRIRERNLRCDVAHRLHAWGGSNLETSHHGAELGRVANLADFPGEIKRLTPIVGDVVKMASGGFISGSQEAPVLPFVRKETQRRKG